MNLARSSEEFRIALKNWSIGPIGTCVQRTVGLANHKTTHMNQHKSYNDQFVSLGIELGSTDRVSSSPSFKLRLQLCLKRLNYWLAC